MLTLQLTPLLINDNESDHPPNFTYHQGRLLDPEVFQGAFGSLISIHEAHVHVGLALPLDLITSLWVDGGPFCVTEKEEEMLLKGSHHTGTRDSDAAENGFQKTGSDTDPTPTTPTSPTKSPWMGVLDQSVLASYIRGSIIVRQPWASSLAPPLWHVTSVLPDAVAQAYTSLNKFQQREKGIIDTVWGAGTFGTPKEDFNVDEGNADGRGRVLDWESDGDDERSDGGRHLGVTEGGRDRQASHRVINRLR
eukprot:GHVN01089028.1.p1 GENE.GHVN01089028.1~~GHVN01089028.1.p1  ORF type:complete len:250 (+),score=51.32 GHVN01089028.1:839-1588(+)